MPLRACRYIKGMQDSKGPITSSALNKMMKKFEATSSLVSRRKSGRPSTAAVVATAESRRCNPCPRLLHLGKFRVSRIEVSGDHCE
ncbi:hypothetical protein TNIN_101201 [Trichonephila inaurata madagascariensis]|uniref:DUF4817 domain-containing protein n=1 Tax=Trichonephila inaurata madagascariensis TaxID=2747483 RepID=A0A8X6Y9A5_9ARAC|nr:hypothetical protein TNIN_101201 [Trichonephila inaurata madagascariensis]